MPKTTLEDLQKAADENGFAQSIENDRFRALKVGPLHGIAIFNVDQMDQAKAAIERGEEVSVALK